MSLRIQPLMSSAVHDLICFHCLTYHNVKAIAAIPEMHELNIGHAIIGRAVMTGLKDAVAEMKRLMLEARG